MNENYVEIFKQTYPHLYDEYILIHEQQLELFARKMLSYGIDNIALGTELKTKEDVKLSLTGIFIRCLDKTNRLKNRILHNNKESLQDESIVDTYQDLVNYNIISQIVLKGNWKK